MFLVNTVNKLLFIRIMLLELFYNCFERNGNANVICKIRKLLVRWNKM